jgi:hypothetical protein
MNCIERIKPAVFHQRGRCETTAPPPWTRPGLVYLRPNRKSHFNDEWLARRVYAPDAMHFLYFEIFECLKTVRDGKHLPRGSSLLNATTYATNPATLRRILIFILRLSHRKELIANQNTSVPFLLHSFFGGILCFIFLNVCWVALVR